MATEDETKSYDNELANNIDKEMEYHYSNCQKRCNKFWFCAYIGSPGGPGIYYKWKYLLVYTNIPFFIASFYLFFNFPNGQYIFEGLLLLWMGLISTAFHGSQCYKGHKHEWTSHLCRIDIISCLVVGIYLFIVFSWSLLILIISICILWLPGYVGKYYVFVHSIWHVLAAFYLLLCILYNDTSNLFTAKWWDLHWN